MSVYDDFLDTLEFHPYGDRVDKFVISKMAIFLLIGTVIVVVFASIALACMVFSLADFLQSKVPSSRAPLSTPTPSLILGPIPRKAIRQQEKRFVASANTLVRTLHYEAEEESSKAKAGFASSDLDAVYARAVLLLADAMVIYKKDIEEDNKKILEFEWDYRT